MKTTSEHPCSRLRRLTGVGHPGGGWELEYTDHDIAFARDVVTAVIEGRVSERTAFARSAFTITRPRADEVLDGQEALGGVGAEPQ